MFANEETKAEYRKAWDEWRKQVDHLHRVFLEGEQMRPDQLKALLTREARRKDLYDAARLRLLGLDPGPDESPAVGGENPFRS
jgi:hypothetical protein